MRSAAITALLAPAALAAALLTGTVAQADEAEQAARLHHFEFLRERGVFESMGVVDGAPTLTLGAWQAVTDEPSLEAFCAVIFAYYAELDPASYGALHVIDGATGQEIATVDASGYHASVGAPSEPAAPAEPLPEETAPTEETTSPEAPPEEATPPAPETPPVTEESVPDPGESTPPPGEGG